MTIIHWLDDDAGYENWLSQHPDGFMANLNRQPHARYFRIHRATHRLPDRSNPESVNPRTGNNYSKVTADQLSELIDWVKGNLPELALADVNYCKTCDPRGNSPVNTAPTADFQEYVLRANQIIAQGQAQRPTGVLKPEAVIGQTQQFFRDPKVRAWILLRADRVCELCKMPAPFVTDHEEPFLESHHLVLLSQGGSDTPENTAALCPNCHRKMHFGKNRIELRDLLLQMIMGIEAKTRAVSSC